MIQKKESFSRSQKCCMTKWLWYLNIGKKDKSHNFFFKREAMQVTGVQLHIHLWQSRTTTRKCEVWTAHVPLVGFASEIPGIAHRATVLGCDLVQCAQLLRLQPDLGLLFLLPSWNKEGYIDSSGIGSRSMESRGSVGGRGTFQWASGPGFGERNLLTFGHSWSNPCVHPQGNPG